MTAKTPPPPYYAVIFSSLRSTDTEGYAETAQRMLELAKLQPGYLGVESVSEGDAGITVSYWRSLEAIEGWKRHSEHTAARAEGRRRWYYQFALRVARVERAAEFARDRRGDG